MRSIRSKVLQIETKDSTRRKEAVLAIFVLFLFIFVLFFGKASGINHVHLRRTIRLSLAAFSIDRTRKIRGWPRILTDYGVEKDLF